MKYTSGFAFALEYMASHDIRIALFWNEWCLKCDFSIRSCEDEDDGGYKLICEILYCLLFGILWLVRPLCYHDGECDYTWQNLNEILLCKVPVQLHQTGLGYS